MLFMNKMMLIHKVCWVLGLHRLYHIDLGGPVKKYRVDKYIDLEKEKINCY